MPLVTPTQRPQPTAIMCRPPLHRNPSQAPITTSKPYDAADQRARPWPVACVILVRRPAPPL